MATSTLAPVTSRLPEALHMEDGALQNALEAQGRLCLTIGRHAAGISGVGSVDELPADRAGA
jgi:hypothetical protein